MGLLDTTCVECELRGKRHKRVQRTGGGGRLASGLGGKLLAGGLTTRGFACGLLGSGHGIFCRLEEEKVKKKTTKK